MDKKDWDKFTLQSMIRGLEERRSEMTPEELERVKAQAKQEAELTKDMTPEEKDAWSMEQTRRRSEELRRMAQQRRFGKQERESS